MSHIIDKSHLDSLTSWVRSKLRNICTYPPDRKLLLSHILRTLDESNNNTQELKDKLVRRLHHILQDKTTNFVNNLLDALDDKRYLDSKDVGHSSSDSQPTQEINSRSNNSRNPKRKLRSRSERSRFRSTRDLDSSESDQDEDDDDGDGDDDDDDDEQASDAAAQNVDLIISQSTSDLDEEFEMFEQANPRQEKRKDTSRQASVGNEEEGKTQSKKLKSSDCENRRRESRSSQHSTQHGESRSRDRYECRASRYDKSCNRYERGEGSNLESRRDWSSRHSHRGEEDMAASGDSDLRHLSYPAPVLANALQRHSLMPREEEAITSHPAPSNEIALALMNEANYGASVKNDLYQPYPNCMPSLNAFNKSYYEPYNPEAPASHDAVLLSSLFPNVFNSNRLASSLFMGNADMNNRGEAYNPPHVRHGRWSSSNQSRGNMDSKRVNNIDILATNKEPAVTQEQTCQPAEYIPSRLSAQDLEMEHSAGIQSTGDAHNNEAEDEQSSEGDADGEDGSNVTPTADRENAMNLEKKRSSLLVKCIPSYLNNIESINQHFAQFGKIIYIGVMYNGSADAAIVTFESVQEATAAIRSVDAVMGNRFIKVHWANRAPSREGHNSKQHRQPFNRGRGYFGQRRPNAFLHQHNNDGNENNLLELEPPHKRDVFAQPSASNGAPVCNVVESPRIAKAANPVSKVVFAMPRIERMRLERKLSTMLQDKSDALKNQKMLIDKVEKATNAKERKALVNLVKNNMNQLEDLNKQIKEIHNKLDTSLTYKQPKLAEARPQTEVDQDGLEQGEAEAEEELTSQEREIAEQFN